MTALRPFFLLVGRASVFWLGAIGLFVVSIIVAGLAGPDERLSPLVDAVFIAAVAFPGCAGLLAGAVIQEFQHTSFAAVLPGVRRRSAAGFLATGLAVSVIVVGSIALMGTTPQELPLLFVVGLGAYCLGGTLIDPLSAWITSFNVILALALITMSRDISQFAGDHPWLTVAVSLGGGAVCSARLFARSTFRRKPLRPTTPLPGRFSLERTRQAERRKRAQDGPRETGWRTGYLGIDPWRWVRAAVHEVRGAHGWKTVPRAIGRAWGLGGLILIYTWADKGDDMAFGEALARSIFDALLRSPHEPQFGEHGGPYPIVALALAAAGVVTALFSPIALNDGMGYPLSRRQRGRVLYRCGLVNGAIVLLLVAPCLLFIGQLAGWLAGYEIRFDFMPFFFRVLLITVTLMPLAHRGRLQLQEAARRKSENTLIAVISGIIGFIVAVYALAYLSAEALDSPIVELVTLAAALVVSQLLYRRALTGYFRTADLA